MSPSPRHLAPLAALLLGACDPDVAFNDVATTLLLWPDVLDLGNVPAGATSTAAMRLEHVAGGTITIDTVAFEGDGAALFDVSEFPVTLGPGDALPLEVTYAPDAEGYHLATLVVTSDAAATPRLEVSARGRASSSALRAWPSLLDLGPVAVGEQASGTITIENDGGLDVLFDNASVGAPFSVSTSVPIAVSGTTRTTVDVVGSPSDDDAVLDTLVLSGPGPELEVTVRINDCQHGPPSLYDKDQDGITPCAGDCDDGAADVHPGATESCNGIDDDCDDTIDEGTSCYDDDNDGRTEDEGDCNDGDPNVSDTTVEVPGNGIDDDCDGRVDVGGTDVDGDGYGPGAGGDCDDNDSTRYPGAPEVIDGDDENCNGLADDGTDAYDDDGDGQSEQQGDCDDEVPTIFLGATEQPNGADDDCDGRVDEGTVRYDDDADGYTELGGDCDDGNASITPPC